LNPAKNVFLLAAWAWLLSSAGQALSQSITVNALVPFSVTIVQPTTAGNDIINQYANTLGDYNVDIKGGSYTTSWHVDISKTVTAGDPDLELDVLRDPNNNDVTSGPTTFTAIPNDPSSLKLFSANGKRNVNNVQIQYQLVASTATTDMHQGNFTITVLFTLSSGL